MPESAEAEEELSTVSAHLQDHLKQFGVQVRHHELGRFKLDQLYSSQNSFIDVLESVPLPANVGIRQ